MLQQELETTLQAAADDPGLVVPEDAVVDDNEIGVSLGGGFEESHARRDAADYFADLGTSLHLQPLGPVVAEIRNVQVALQVGEDLVPGDRGRHLAGLAARVDTGQ